MKSLLTWFFNPPTTGPRSTLLLRLMAGGVFLWEGILKFVYVNQGVGRFTKLGMPLPHLTANFVATLEIVGGLLLLSGLMTRLIAVPFIFEMVVAMLSTKISLFLGHSPLPLPPTPPTVGIWAVLHEVRSEWAQLWTVTFLLINGPGKWSLDALLANERQRVNRVYHLVPTEKQVARTAGILLLMLISVSAVADSRRTLAAPGSSVSNTQLPQGVKVLARVALQDLAVTQMYTQWEYGRTYLYIEHGPQPLTAVDVTQKRQPVVVRHQPARVERERYEQLAEGGSIQVSPLWNVNPGVDNKGDRGTYSVLQNGDPGDATLLRVLGQTYSNLVDRDSGVVYFASPSQLLIVQDERFETTVATY